MVHNEVSSTNDIPVDSTRMDLQMEIKVAVVMEGSMEVTITSSIKSRKEVHKCSLDQDHREVAHVCWSNERRICHRWF